MKKGHLLWNLEVIMEERLAAAGGEVAFWTCYLERFLRGKTEEVRGDKRGLELQSRTFWRERGGLTGKEGEEFCEFSRELLE